LLADELRKHSCTSAALRRLALRKQAGAVGDAVRTMNAPWTPKNVWRGAKALGTQALAHPMGALVGGLGTVAAFGKARSTMAQFNPAVHRAQLGISPQ